MRRWMFLNRLRGLVGLKPLPKSCCRDQKNLHVIEEVGDRVTRRCRVCKCRHFELTVDPGRLGVQLR